MELNLTISRRENKLDGIVLYEPVDLVILDKLLWSDLLQETIRPGKDKIVQYPNEHTYLKKYRENINEETGLARVQYKRHADIPYGRSNPVRALGLYQIRREIRHTLAGSNFVDIDIDNAHPTMLKQVLEANEIECPYLSNYVEMRSEWIKNIQRDFCIAELSTVKELKGHLKEIKMKEIAKNLIIRILYGGGYVAWRKDFGIDTEIPIPDDILKLIEEVREVTRQIRRSNPDLVTLVQDHKAKQGKSDYNLDATVASYFLQEKEVIILETIFTYCVEKNYIRRDTCVLCADGLMIEKCLYKESLVQELHEVVLHFTGFNLNFSIKAMDQGYEKILDKHLRFALHERTFSTGLLAEYFRMMFSNRFVNVKGKLYSYNGYFWVMEDAKKHSGLHNFVDTTFHDHLVKMITPLIHAQKGRIAANDVKDLEEILKEELKSLEGFLGRVNKHLRNVTTRRATVDDIMNKLVKNSVEFDENPYLLAFNNGVYDLQKGNWIDPCYSQYISMTTGWNWEMHYPEYKKLEFDSLLNSIMPKGPKQDLLLISLASSLIGQLIEKLFVWLGTGGNGKGLLADLVKKAIGLYAYTLPPNVLLAPIKEGGNPEVAGAHNKRFVVCQEPDDNQRMSTSALKVLTGESEINCRMLYSNDTVMKNKVSFFLQCNEMPKMDIVDGAVERRLLITEFSSKFVEKTKFDEMTPQQREEQNIFLADPYYKSRAFQEEFKQALMIILMGKATELIANGLKLPDTPIEVLRRTQAYLETSDDVYSWILENYELDPDHSEVIYLTDLYTQYTRSDSFELMTKKQKKECTQRKFVAKLKENIHLNSKIRLAKTRFNGVQQTKDYLLGFKKIRP
jgi:P4 family phage/plasmid primase-like protien